MSRTSSPRSSLALALALAPAAVAQDSQQAPPELTLESVLEENALRPELPEFGFVPGTHTVHRTAGSGAGTVAATRDADGSWQERFDAATLAAAIGATDIADVDAETLEWEWIDPDQVRVEHRGEVLHWRIGDEAARRVLFAVTGGEPTASAYAPGDQRAAHVVRHQLWVTQGDGRQRQISWDGSPDIVYGGAAHRAEFGIRDGLWWDDSGRRLAFSREDQRPIEPFPYADVAAHPPAAVAGRYPMAGRAHASVSIGVYDSADGSLHYLEHDPDDDVYWTNVTFSADGAHVFVALVSRGQDHMQLVRFDAATGARGPVLFEERDPEWVEPELGPIAVPGTAGDFLWRSPRNGYHHLYHYRGDGGLVGAVTGGEFDVRAVLGVSGSGASARVLYLASTTDPLDQHLWSVPIGGGTPTQCTTARGWHEATVSDDGQWAIARHSNLDDPGGVQLVSTAGAAATTLVTAADPFAGRVVGGRRFFRLDAADGTPMHGLLLQPGAPQPDRKHPILHYVYGGPHSQLVRDAWLGGASPWLHYMAMRGYIVLILDNRGTGNRGIEFAQTVFRRLSALEVEDQSAALAWANQLPYADPDRVGVHGWSYGGYMTLALMTRTRSYRCGVAGAPVTDWAQYETGYTERYMDTPAENPDGYANASVIDRAADLHGRLLLVHGTDDKTVMWSHPMRFLDACIEHDVLVDFMAYPMAQHGLRGADRRHFYRLMTRFFDEQLQLSTKPTAPAEAESR